MESERQGEFYSPYPEEERRKQLRRLDDILEALEQLNLNEQSELTPELKRILESHGLKPEKATITQLIEEIWKLQEKYMLQIPVERRKSQRRRPPRTFRLEVVIDSAIARLKREGRL
jgi:hypothetical protein